VRPWRALADRIVPPEAIAGAGLVPWRMQDPPSAQAARSLGTTLTAIPVSRSLLEDAGMWVSPSGAVWRRWPSVNDLLVRALTLPRCLP
jgi:hypothetical protein